MYEILERTPAIPDNCQWGLFLRNHDELTLEMVTDEERDYMYAEYAKDPRMKANVGIRRRLAPLLDNDRNQIELFTALGYLGLFWLLIGLNWQQMPYLTDHPFSIFKGIPWVHIVVFLHAAALFSLLVVAAVCDIDRREIPLAFTLPGTLLGLVFAILLPWPWPSVRLRRLASATPAGPRTAG